jgi:hypothetical protein
MLESLAKRINDGVLWYVAGFIFLLGLSAVFMSGKASVNDVKIDLDYVLDTQKGERHGSLNPDQIEQLIRAKFIDGKNVGYTSAMNWWPTNILLMPLLVISMTLLISSINMANLLLVENKMVVYRKNNAAIPKINVLKESWLKYLQNSLWIWILLSLLGFYLSFDEYSSEAYSTLSSRIINLEISPDWSIACLLTSNIDCNLNLKFNGLAFFIQGVILSAFFLMLCIVGAYGVYICKHRSYRHEWYFIPNIHSKDVRKGFEIFETVGNWCLACGGIAYLAGFCIIVQNTYLVDAGSTSMIGEESSFLFSISMEMIKQVVDSDSVINAKLWVIEMGELSNVWAVVAIVVVIILVVAVVPGLILRNAAINAKNNLSKINKANKEGLSEMRVWPYEWMNFKFLIFSISLGLFFIVIPSLAIYMLGVYLSLLIIWAKKKLGANVVV